jgi:hypothetical protein
MDASYNYGLVVSFNNQFMFFNLSGHAIKHLKTNLAKITLLETSIHKRHLTIMFTITNMLYQLFYLHLFV